MQTPQLEKERPISEPEASVLTGSVDTLWLSWLHEMLPDVSQLQLYRVKPNQAVEQCAQTPPVKQLSESQAIESVDNAVLRSVHHKQAIYVNDATDKQLSVLTIPFECANQQPYVLVMLSTGLTSVQQNTAVRLTQWAAVQLRESSSAVPADARQSDAVQQALPEAQLAQALVGAQQRHGTFTAMAFTLVNSMANLCGCVRVSLGCHDGRRLRLIAMSGQPKVDDRRKIARQLCALMLDTMESERVIYPNGSGVATPSQQAYYKSQGEHPLLSFTMPGSNADKFVLVLERAKDNPFIAAQADAIEQSVSGSASLLELSRAHEQPLRQKLILSLRHHIAQMKYINSWSKRRWLGVVLFSCLIGSFIIPVTHRVSADAFIEASDRQVLVAAQNGFILSAHARAGEEVRKGDLLAKIDGQDLQLALEKWRSEEIKNQQEYAQALAIHDRNELSRLRADAKRVEAEIALIEQQLRRSEVRAPFDGVLLDGDWTQSLGAPVAAGDVLFEIASAEQYRLVLKVDEHDIGYIEPQQIAQLRMAALPTTVWQAELGDVLPVAVSVKGSSAFRVPANIEGDANALRPGMEGVGKVIIGQRSLFWVYTHKMVNKLRYVAWKVGLL